jgi:hypothetical protein
MVDLPYGLWERGEGMKERTKGGLGGKFRLGWLRFQETL